MDYSKPTHKFGIVSYVGQNSMIVEVYFNKLPGMETEACQRMALRLLGKMAVADSHRVEQRIMVASALDAREQIKDEARRGRASTAATTSRSWMPTTGAGPRRSYRSPP